MDTAIDLRVAEMLCSRLCHDLISPVGAINSGLELISEFGGEPDDEAMGLINGSATQAAGKLQFFRVAYGLAGGGTGLALPAAAEAASILVGGGRTSLDWPVTEQPEVPALPGDSLKLLLNMILLAAEALPRGGSLRVRLAPGDNSMAAQVLAEGEGASFKPEVMAAFDRACDVDDLTARTVQGYYTALVGERLGVPVEIEQSASVSLEARLPVAP